MIEALSGSEQEGWWWCLVSGDGDPETGKQSPLDLLK